MIYDSQAETLEHIRQVRERLAVVCAELRERGDVHDRSKLGPNEKPIFDEMTPKLKGLAYGSEEYRASLKALGPALEHHYRENSHHPEHYANGVAGMDLIDLVEMYCDWAAAVVRHDTGDLGKSIEINATRFAMGDVLASIFRNTLVRHGGFCGYQDYHLAWPWPEGEDGWTMETDIGTGQQYRRRPKPNAAIEQNHQRFA